MVVSDEGRVPVGLWIERPGGARAGKAEAGATFSANGKSGPGRPGPPVSPFESSTRSWLRGRCRRAKIARH